MEEWNTNPRNEWNSPKLRFHCSGAAVGATLYDYWWWRGSNLLDNIERGFLAEFLVAKSLDLVGETRREWGAFDLKLPDANRGEGTKIEVKSSAYLQSWPQEKDSTISFGIKPVKFVFDALTSSWTKHDPQCGLLTSTSSATSRRALGNAIRRSHSTSINGTSTCLRPRGWIAVCLINRPLV